MHQNQTMSNSNGRCEQVNIGNLMVATTTVVNKPVHYAIYLKREGVDYLLTAWYDISAQRVKRVAEVIAEAYKRVFMWIRPQMSNGLFVDNLNDRMLFLDTLNHVYLSMFGFGNDLIPNEYIFHDVRQVRSATTGTASLFRTYDHVYERFTTTVVVTTAVRNLVEVSTSDRDIDPGDFIPREWTGLYDDPLNNVPVIEEPDLLDDRPPIA